MLDYEYPMVLSMSQTQEKGLVRWELYKLVLLCLVLCLASRIPQNSRSCPWPSQVWQHIRLIDKSAIMRLEPERRNVIMSINSSFVYFLIIFNSYDVSHFCQSTVFSGCHGLISWYAQHNPNEKDTSLQYLKQPFSSAQKVFKAD